MTTDDDAAVDPSKDDATAGADGGDEEPKRRFALPRRTPKGGEKKHLPVWQESLLLLVIALGLAIIIKAFFVQAFYIPSPSMEPGLVQNDRILVEKPSYWFGGSPKPGDIVVFSDPGNWLSAEEDKGPTGFASLLAKVGLYPTGGHLVKRVIGTPGDVVHCCNPKGQIEVNGHALDEDGFLSKSAQNEQCDAVADPTILKKHSPMAGACNWTIGPVPAGKLFVMGDNRDNSADSRAHMCRPGEDPCTKCPWVPEDLVVGKVFSLVWPHDRWRWFSRPGAFDGIPDKPSGKVSSKNAYQPCV